MSETTETLFERFGPAYRWFVTFTCLAGAFAMVLSATVVNVAVPKIMGAFGVGQDQAQWMATAFLATMTASQLLNAWMIASLGYRAAFIMTLGIFTAGSVVCAAAASIEMLIAGRIMQGFAAGIVQPLAMVTIVQVFPENRRGTAMGIFGAGVTLAPGIGPFVGGIAIDVVSWRFMFLLPLGFVFLAFIGGLLFMPTRDETRRRPPFDWGGYILLCTALVLAMTAIARGPVEGWTSNTILLEAAGALLAGTAFVAWQMRSRSPLLAVELFSNPVFLSALVVAFVFGMGNFGSSYLIPVFVQEVQGFTPTKAGLVLVPAGLALVVALPFTGRLADHVPGHLMVLLGLACFALGTAFMVTSDVNTAFWTFAFYTAVSRIGLAFILPSLSATAFRALGPSDLTKGAGNMNFIRQLGGATGTNLIVVWLQMRTARHGEFLTATQTPDNETTRELLRQFADKLGILGIPDGIRDPVALDFLGRVVLAQAEMFGFRDSFLALAVVFALALIPAWVLGRAGRRRDRAEAAE